ncbi:hypothetical protein O988_00515, partial [Pseudogymnoascus sp. VKM F-3808]
MDMKWMKHWFWCLVGELGAGATLSTPARHYNWCMGDV